jgi:uncharacterized protein YkwD
MRCRAALASVIAAACAGPGTGAATSTETATAAAPAPAPATTPPGRLGADDYREQVLALHNEFRANHCAPPLTWSKDLAKVAQAWADNLDARGCAFEHSRTNLGENLAAGSGQHLRPRTVVGMWYREVARYDFKRGTFAMDTGHFTQLVWVATERIGCGRRLCGNGVDIVVCNYDPPGNVEGRFKRNVLPTTCKKEGR